MKYKNTYRLNENQFINIENLKSTLLPNGFKLATEEESKLIFTGPGLYSTKEAPIRGATKITFEKAVNEVTLTANLFGVLFLSLFACLFPPVLATILALTNDNDGSKQLIEHIWLWVFIGPAISWWVYRRTVSALNILLENAIQK